MLLLLFLAASIAGAQDFTFTPPGVRQGETLTLHGGGDAAKARMNSITIPLFATEDGGTFGLLPVGVEAEPGDYKLEFLNQAGEVIRELTVSVHDAHYPKQNIVISEALSELRASTGEAEMVHAFLGHGLARSVLEGTAAIAGARMHDFPFGASRLHNGKPTGDYHGGVDQRGAPGVPIHAVAAGTVRIARMFTLRGGTVGIDHGQGLETIYMHMSKVAAKEGQHVEAGGVIGYIGSTGRATGPHLHWSLYANGHPVSPNQWVKLTACGSPRAKPRPKKK